MCALLGSRRLNRHSLLFLDILVLNFCGSLVFSRSFCLGLHVDIFKWNNRRCCILLGFTATATRGLLGRLGIIVARFSGFGIRRYCFFIYRGLLFCGCLCRLTGCFFGSRGPSTLALGRLYSGRLLLLGALLLILNLFISDGLFFGIVLYFILFILGGDRIILCHLIAVSLGSRLTDALTAALSWLRRIGGVGFGLMINNLKHQVIQRYRIDFL